MCYSVATLELLEESMQYLTPTELLKVLAEAKRQGSKQHLLVLLGYSHGLRASELSALTLADVRNGNIECRRLKGSLQQLQPLETNENPLLDERRALSAYLRERGDADGSQFLFVSRQGSGFSRRQIYNIFEDVAMRAGIESGRRNPHILKHSLASHLIRAGASVAYVQIRCGHKDPKATLSYTHITDLEAADHTRRVLGSVFAAA
jgi:site-specific recombinase XerD